MKRLALTLAVVIGMATSASAQWNSNDIWGEDYGGGVFGKGAMPESARGGDPLLPSLPSEHGLSDNASPLGGGVMLLLGFGAAYAMCKRKEED